MRVTNFLAGVGMIKTTSYPGHIFISMTMRPIKDKKPVLQTIIFEKLGKG